MQHKKGFQASDLELQTDENLSQAELAKVWARRAQALAVEPPAEVIGQTLNLLVFWMGGERYGVEVANVGEIYPLSQLTPIPRTPPFVVGVFSARGRIVSVIDLRAFLGMSPLECSEQTKVVMVASTDPALEMEIGILTDEVTDIITIFKESIASPLTTQVGTRADYLQGITADLLIVLNLNALLKDKRLIIYEEIL